MIGSLEHQMPWPFPGSAWCLSSTRNRMRSGRCIGGVGRKYGRDRARL